MPKPKASVETVKIGITTSKKVARFLDVLIETELFGRSRAEVAEQLIRRTMEKFITKDKIQKLNVKRYGK